MGALGPGFVFLSTVGKAKTNKQTKKLQKSVKHYHETLKKTKLNGETYHVNEYKDSLI